MNETITPEWDKLVSLGCVKITSYTGGIYVGFSEFHVWVCCRRGDQMHAVAFEPAVFRKLEKYGDTPA